MFMALLLTTQRFCFWWSVFSVSSWDARQVAPCIAIKNVAYSCHSHIKNTRNLFVRIVTHAIGQYLYHIVWGKNVHRRILPFCAFLILYSLVLGRRAPLKVAHPVIIAPPVFMIYERCNS